MAATVASPLSWFQSTSGRSPTRPEDVASAVDDTISCLDENVEIEGYLKRTVVPLESPTEEQPEPNLSASRPSPAHSYTTKKVDFSPWPPTYYRNARSGISGSFSDQLVKCTPSGRDAKPAKSILKQFTPPTPDDIEVKLRCFSPRDPSSFATMLQSVIQQLASQVQSSRLDAYLALNGALRAYDGVPDPAAMASKLTLLVQFLTRDIAWKTESGALDTNIVTQALKLASVILYLPNLSDALDDDFRTFLIERSIFVISNSESPKPVLKQHLYLLAQQRFPSSIMTSGRVDKIISSINTIEDRCGGNSVVATRLMVYRRLTEQTPMAMLHRSREWLEHIFHGMLSSVKEVRIRAIEAGTSAGLAFGSHWQGAKSLLDLFETEVEEGESYCDFLNFRLMQMVGDKELGPYVPQIWSAVVLFFRSKRKSVENWARFKSWLLIIQKCLNASNAVVRYQGLLAWNKLIFCTMPNASTSQTMFSMLKVPIIAGFDKRGNDRQYALNSYNMLLHYAFRPGISQEEIAHSWNEYVDTVLASMVKSSSNGLYAASRVLYGLCTTSVGVWNANAAHEAAPIKPEELPRIDCRWVRLNLSKFLHLLEPLLSSTMYATSESSAVVDAAYSSVLQSVADAGSQEVRTSNELKCAIALIVSMLKRLWERCSLPAPVDECARKFLGRFTCLIDATVDTIGIGPFTEEILTKTQEDEIEPNLTPSHRFSKHHTTPRSPLVLFFGWLYGPPQALCGTEVQPALSELSEHILNMLLSSRQSTAEKLEVIHRSSEFWAQFHALDSSPEHIGMLWSQVATSVTSMLEAGDNSGTEHDSQPLGYQVRNALGVLQLGLKQSGESQVVHQWATTLYESIVSICRSKAGIAGAVQAVVEPFAKSLHSDSDLNVVSKAMFASTVLDSITWPRSRQELENARKTLWGVNLAPHNANEFDALAETYRMICLTSTELYRYLQPSNENLCNTFVKLADSMITLMKSCPLSLLAVALRKSQDGFIIWVQDRDEKIATHTNISAKVISVWYEVLDLLRTIPTKDLALLSALEPLLIAGFVSPHKAIVSGTITFWNSYFGNMDGLEYPTELVKVLRARSRASGLLLPCSPKLHVDESSVQLPAVFKAQIDLDEQAQVASNTIGDRAKMSTLGPLNECPKSVPIAIDISFEPTQHSTPKPRSRSDEAKVQYVSTEAPPNQLIYESHAFTEYQQHITAFQEKQGRLFPDLSSSPVAESAVWQGTVSKQPNFLSMDIPCNPEQTDNTSPVAVPEIDALMSDDLPSSPTPSQARGVEKVQGQGKEEVAPDEDQNDMPSSPPRIDDEVVCQTDSRNRTVPENLAANLVHLPATQLDGIHHAADEQQTEGRDCLPSIREFLDSDLPSDTSLPTIQLQLEEKAAANVLEPSQKNAAFPEEPPRDDQPGYPAVGNQVYNIAETDYDDSGGDLRPLPKDMDEVTRVEDSFGTNLPAVNPANHGGEAAQINAPRSRKRKRISSVVHNSRKRKQKSPLNQLSVSTLGQSHEDEDYIGDEIVVISTQRSSHPMNQPAPEIKEPHFEFPTKVEPPVESDGIVTTSAEVPDGPSKRGRGRPKKTQNQYQSRSQPQSYPIPSRRLKRKGSALSGTCTEDPNFGALIVSTTPPSTRLRKPSQNQDKRSRKSARPSRNHIKAATSRGGQLAAIVLPHSQDVAEQEESDASEWGEPDTPEKQLTREALQAVKEQQIGTSRTLLGRLRDILSDCRNMVLGRDEEREIDDVLFELRQSVHEAGRRGR